MPSWQLVVYVAGTLLLVGFVCLNSWAAAALLRRQPLAYNPLLHPLENLGRLVLVGICLLLSRVSGLPDAAFGFVDPDPAANLLLGVACGLVLLGLNHYGTRWVLRRWGAGTYAPALLRAMLPGSSREWLFAAPALLLAALGEELLFRSLALGGLAAFWPALALAVVFSLAFGLAHLPQGKLGVVGAGLLGFLLSLLFLWRWSLLACTVAHLLVNLGQLYTGERELRWLERSAASNEGGIQSPGGDV